MTIKDLKDFRSANIEMCDKTTLVNLKNIKVNTNEYLENRTLDFARQIGNPYLFRVGDIAVKVSYCGKKSLSEALINVLNAS